MRLENQIALELGDNILVHLKSGQDISAELAGFGLIPLRKEYRYSIMVNRLNMSQVSNYNMESISGVSTIQGKLIEKDQLLELIDCGMLPTKSGIGVENSSGIHHVAVNEVTEIKKQVQKQTGRMVGLYMGMAADLTIISCILFRRSECEGPYTETIDLEELWQEFLEEIEL